MNADLPSRGSYPDIAGKVAVITGGSRGIGAATAQAVRGADVTTRIAEASYQV